MGRRDDRKLVVGLDIGTSKVSAIVGEISPEDKLEVIGIGSNPSRGLKRGVVVNIESTVQSIQRAIEEAELMAGCEINDRWHAAHEEWRPQRFRVDETIWPWLGILDPEAVRAELATELTRPQLLDELEAGPPAGMNWGGFRFVLLAGERVDRRERAHQVEHRLQQVDVDDLARAAVQRHHRGKRRGQEPGSRGCFTQIGGVDQDTQEETRRLNEEMALAAIAFLGTIMAMRPPFSVVFTV